MRTQAPMDRSLLLADDIESAAENPFDSDGFGS